MNENVRIAEPPKLGYHIETVKRGLGKRLLQLRESRMLFRTTAAKLAGVSKSHLYDIERRGSTPRIDTLLRLANTYGVSIDYLVFDSALSDALPDALKEFTEGQRFR